MGSEMSVIAALVSLLTEIGGWPTVVILMVLVVAPVVLLIYVIRNLIVAVVSLREEVRSGMATHDANYANNITLVKSYELLAGELTTIVRLNTATSTQLTDLIRHFISTTRSS